MLIKDGETLVRHALGRAAEAERQRIADWAKAQLGQGIVVKEGENPANVARQWGNSMHPETLLLKLKRINPSFTDELVAMNVTKRRLYFTDRAGRHQVCLFENEVMPEHSIHAVKDEDVPLAFAHIHRNDLTKYEVTPDGIVFDDTVPLAGAKRIQILWHEVVRGWRTVLVRIVQQGYATVEQVEREFGADNRPEWQGKMGKSKVVTPW